MTVAAPSPRESTAPPAAAAEAGTRPLVAIIANVQTPYRVHLHKRLIRELPEYRFASVFTHDQPDQAWASGLDPAINPVEFGRGEPVSEQGTPRRWPADWRRGGRIIRWLKSSRAAAVLVGGYNDPARIRVIAWCARAKVPCFLYADSNIHGDRARGWKRMVKKALVGWVVRRCAGLMPYGSNGRAYFERFGGSSKPVYYFPCEPDYEQIQSLSERQIAAACERFGLRDGRTRIVVCSRLVPHKRIDLAIAAFAAMAADRPETDLVIVGDGPERARLEAMVPAALRARVVWTGFVGDQATVSALYRASHVLLCPSDYEPWGLVINESAAAGMAIVATRVVGAAPELVRDGVNGRVVPPGDPGAMAAALRDATDPATLRRMRAASAQVLEQWRSAGDPVAGLRRALGRAAGGTA